MVSQNVETALIAASTTVVIAAFGFVAAFVGSNRARRRQMYGEALRAALIWVELYYRVVRRSTREGGDDELVQRFHVAQEDIYYYTGWIGSESPRMRRSYDRLVDEVKEATGDRIRAAWKEKPKPSADFQAEPVAVDAEVDRFLQDVRWHLAWWQLPKVLLVFRYRGKKQKVPRDPSQ